jgi:mono/diheme cytochrome c family protein
MKLLLPIAVAMSAAVAAAPHGSPRAPNPRHIAWAAVQDPDGRKLYLKNCRQCHGATGDPSDETKEKYPKIKTLSDAAFLAKLADDSMATVIKKGKGKDMKSFSDRLTDTEIAAVVKYVRTLPEQKKDKK